MNKFQTLAAVGLTSFAMLAVGQQSQSTPDSSTPPPATTQTDSAPMTKSQIKEQRKQQKHDEKAAKEAAKAQKSQADALKHQNHAMDEKEKAQQHQSVSEPASTQPSTPAAPPQ